MKGLSLSVCLVLSANASLAVPPAVAYQPDPSSLVGRPAPELKLKDVNGKEVSLAQHRGKVVVLAFHSHT